MPNSDYEIEYPGKKVPDILAKQLRSYQDLQNLPSPEISVLTPSFNTAKFLEDTIRSVANQSFRNFEHIVIDGGSTDGTVEILKKYPHIRWISEKDSGYPEAFRKGLKMARGKYIMQCAVSDCYANQNWLKYCANFLNSHPEVSLVGGITQNLLEDGRPDHLILPQKSFLKASKSQNAFGYCLMSWGAIDQCNLCAHKEVVENCYPKTNAETEEMVDWLFFINKFLQTGYIPEVLPVVAAYSRKHSGQMGQVWARSRKLKLRHQNFVGRMFKLRREVLSGRRKVVFCNYQGSPIPNQTFDYRKFRTEFFAYKISYWNLSNTFKNLVIKVKNRSKRFIHS